MKHTLLSISMLFVATAFSFAQTCTPDQQFIGSAPGIYPATPLEPSCDLTAAKTVISLTDTTVLVQGIQATIYFDALRINEVQGLPGSLTLETDVMNSQTQTEPYGIWLNTGSVPNQTSAIGCAFAFGTSGDWDALAGNNYPLTFIVDARVGGVNPSFLEGFLSPGTWMSTVDPALGGGAFVIEQTLNVPSDYADISTSISGSANVEPGTTYTYSAPQYAGVTYEWTVTNGSIQSGQGTNEIEVVWSGNGNVEVDLTDGGCMGTDNLDVVAMPVGLDEVAGISASVYPNPSDGLFNIHVANTDELQAQVFDVSGKVILSQQFAGSNLYSLDMENVQSGIYILELESSKGKTFKRLIRK